MMQLAALEEELKTIRASSHTESRLVDDEEILEAQLAQAKRRVTSHGLHMTNVWRALNI